MKVYEKFLRSIIGNNKFESCIVFFQEFLERKSRYKIIMTRRCFVLYKAFLPVLKSMGIENCYGKIITDKSMALYYDEIIAAIKDCRGNDELAVLIIDDIVIYGRTVSETLDSIMKSFEEPYNDILNHILIMCFSVSTSTSKIERKYEGILSTKNHSTKLDWKKTSSQFSSIIKATCVPNTSYIISYKKKFDCKLFNQLENQLKGKADRIFNDELNNYKISAFVCKADEKKCNINSCTMNSTLISCIRVYFDRNSNSVTISPLHIFNDMSMDLLDKICDELIDKIDDCPNIKTILSLKDENLYSVKLRLLILIFSHSLLVNFLKKQNILDFNKIENYDYRQILDYNFNEEISKDFVLLHKQILKEQIIDYEYIRSAQSDESEQKLNIDIFKHAMKDNYIALNGQKHRLEGISIQDKNIIPVFNLVSLIDTGKAALKSFFDCDKKIFTSRVFPGEQAFRIMYDQFRDYMDYMYQLENISIICGKDSYTLYRAFIEFLSSKNMLKFDNSHFLNYISILAENSQEISDVYYMADNLIVDDKLEMAFKEFLAKEVELA